MTIRETAAIVPVTLNLRSVTKDPHVRELAIQLENELSPVLRTLGLVADWIENRQLAITSSYEIVDETVILADATSGAIVVTLPASDTGSINREVYVKKVDASANTVTITPRGSDTIDTAASAPLATEGQCHHLIATGIGTWRLLSTISASGGGGVVAPATATPIIVNFTAAAVGVSVKYAREDHRHLLDRTINAIGANSWTGSHAWSPTANAVPIIINKTGSTTSVDLLQILDTDASLLFDVDINGLVGINGDPDALLTIYGGGSVNTITTGLIGWYKADTLTGSLSDGANVVTWMDSSGSGNHLTATGCTATDGVSAVRPHYNAASSAGGAKGMPNLPTVSFEGTLGGSGDMGYFTIDTTKLTLTAAAGWTIAMIVRDYSNVAADSYPLGANLYGGGGDNGDSFIKNVNAASNTRWDTSNGGVAKAFCGLYTHTPDGDVNEIIVLRCDTSGAGSALRAWVDGTLKTATGDTKTIDHIIRYIGRILASVGNPAGVYGKAIAELMIFNVKVSDADVATLNTYLANRRDSTGSTYDLTRWKSALGTTLSRIDSLGQFGFGVATPLAPLHIVLTTEQARIAYDSSNYYSTTVGATGIVTFNAVGAGQSFVFADPVSVTGDITGSSSLRLPYTTSSALGIIFKNSLPWAHDFTNPTGFTDASVDTLANTRSVFLGFNAGNFTMSGTSTQGKANIGIGHYALHALTTGTQNVGIGRRALQLLTTASANLALGTGALGVNLSGDANVAIGAAALGGITTGAENVAIGDSAGVSAVTGSNNTFIGALTDVTGNFSNVIAIGEGVTVDASNKTIIGNTATTLTVVRGTFNTQTLSAGGLDGASLVVNGGDIDGSVTLQSGAGTGVGAGVVIIRTNDSDVAVGGTLYFRTGSGGGGNDGGALDVLTGDGSNLGGPITLVAGAGTNGGGDIIFQAGDTSGALSTVGKFKFIQPSPVGGVRHYANFNFDALSDNRTFTFLDKAGNIVTITGTPQAQCVLSFISNDSNDPSGSPNRVGVMAQVNHDSAGQSPSFGPFGVLGISGVQITTGLTGTIQAGVIGSVFSTLSSTAMAGYTFASFMASAVSQNVGHYTPPAKDPPFTMNNHFRLAPDHITGFWANVLNMSSATGIGTIFPTVVSSARLCIQDYGAPSTNAANTTEYWSIYGENINNVASFPAVTGYLRMPYPRRTGRTGIRAMQIWWEPWPNTSAIRGGSLAGDTYFDDGTNFAAGLYQSVVAGAYQKLLSIVTPGRVTAQTAAVASVAAFTVGASDASFEVSMNVLVTTSTLHTFTCECAYTDEGNTARVLTLQFSNLAGAFVTAIANAAGAVPYEGVPMHIRCKASTTITLRTQAAGTYTTVTFNAEGVIKQLS